MMEILGYKVKELLYESKNSLVYRTCSQENAPSVILKVLNQTYPSPKRIAEFKQEYEITKKLTVSSVVEAYRLELDNLRWVIVLEDFGGESLQRIIPGKQFSLADFLPLAIKIVDILSQVHQRQIIHKDINPSNIVWNQTADIVKLIDFSISSEVSQEATVFNPPNCLEGTLAYISPEQTGRMNRAVDYRTDFYSLGVTFYQLLTERLPFPTNDALEVIHCHIAKSPVPPQECKPDIPSVVSQIVMKLMAKNVEDRYQSVYGLKADLEECWQQWQTSGNINPFPLGRHDISNRFNIQQKLYGREVEIETLLAAFDRVSQGASEMMLVTGHSGIGKSALVGEVYKPITEKQGYFIYGKFEQFQRNDPYSSLIQAFKSLIGQILTESSDRIQVWRDRLLTALGANARVMIDLIPELEAIVGSQPPVPELSPVEAQNRFNLVFENFVRAFTQSDRPLVIFLDDLQWADSASLKSLKLLMTMEDLHHWLPIGSYRDNEVSDGHPLLLVLDEIKKGGVTVNQIELNPLTLADITQLAADTLNCSLETAKPLAELLLTKTHCNPFFVNEFLKSLYAEKLFEFDFQQGVWRWDLDRIRARNITDNVIELMSGKLRQLPEETQELLKLAACLGDRFTLKDLATVAQKSLPETAAGLWDAIAAGPIVPLGNTYKLIPLAVEGLEEEVNVEYKFAHDRIQQAAYSLIPDAQQQSLHWQIGQRLMQNTPSDKLEEKIFDIVRQLNQGRWPIELQAQRDELAQLNAIAARKAKSSAAYESSFNYLQIGIELLNSLESSWERQYDLSLALYLDAAEAASLVGALDSVEEWTEEILRCARDMPERVKTYKIKMQAYLGRQKSSEAIALGLEILEFLDVEFIKQDLTIENLVLRQQQIKSHWEGRNIQDLVDLPEMRDPNKLETMPLLFDILTLGSIGLSGLYYPFLILELVNLSLEFGNSYYSSIAYASYGFLLCADGEVEAGYQFGNLALKILDRFNAIKVKALTIHTFNTFVRPWKESIQKTLEPLKDAHEIGRETGDFNFAGFAIFSFAFNAYWIGYQLEDLESEIVQYSKAISKIGQEVALRWIELVRQPILSLLGRTQNPCVLISDDYNEVSMLPLYQQVSDIQSIHFLHLHKLFLCYLFQDYEKALENAIHAEELMGGARGSFSWVILYFYDSLTRLANWTDLEQSVREQNLEKVAENQQKIEQWAQHAPMNFLHKFYLVEAERARVLERDTEAREYYDRAITLAQENKYLNEEALAYELAGKFYLAKGQNHLARYYLNDARYTYQRWGAEAKVKDLETRYPQLLLKQTSTSTNIADTQSSLPTTSTTGSSNSSTLDFATVIKASQAISSEVVLASLLSNLIKLAIENAGAQKGYLILPNSSSELKIEAIGDIEGSVRVLQSLAVSDSDNLPISVINYVARTQSEVVLNDATQEGQFINDPYILAARPKSVLCAPIINQGKLIGIVYLENNLTTGAFTADRLAVLSILSAQASISIENAQLYQNLEQKVEERTAELAQANAEIMVLNERLKADNLRMSAELEITRRLQQMLLPKPAELEAIQGIDIAGFMEPAEEVGGDYYDVLARNEGATIGIGDVTGHGLESGVLTIVAQTAIRTLLAHSETDPVKFLQTVNQTLFDNVERMNSDKNMTLSLLEYQNQNLRLSGQHEELILVRSGGEVERIDTIDLGFPIGLEANITDFIASTEIALNSGDVVVLYTDGITEAFDLNNVQYGIERLIQVVVQNRSHSAAGIKQAVIDDLRQYIGEQKVFDDITLVIIKQR